MQSNRFFPYHWYIDETERQVTCIRVYGLDSNNKNVCLRVDDFTPFAYLELPCDIDWTGGKEQLLGNKIDKECGVSCPLTKTVEFKKRLYGAHLDKNGNHRLFPYLKCTFSNVNDMKILSYKLRKPLIVASFGGKGLHLKMHESDASPILQLTCCRNISTAGWIDFHGYEQHEDEKVTICDHEYKVSWKNLNPYESNVFPRPLMLGFDIEVNSHNPSKFPDAEREGDKVFQISCVLKRDGDDHIDSHLLTLGNPDQDITGKDVTIHQFKTEASLVQGFASFIRDKAPNIIAGYNILGFDIPYLIKRAKLNCCLSEFDQQGFHKYSHANEKTIKWSSSAYKNQEFQYLDAEGRLYVDLLPLVKRDFKMNNYKLKTVSEYFMGESKDPLSVKGIFKCYRLGTTKNDDGTYSQIARKAMAICGKYCVQDSVLVVRLMDKLKTWVGLTEMAKTCQVSIFSLYTQGQQIKVYSQVYKFCMQQNIVVEKDGYVVAENERYVGAHVFPPVPGRYEKVVPFDFASLYPTIIIAYNIDFHTFVTDDAIPDAKCHVMEWQDCIGCQHDPKVIRKKELTDYINVEREKLKKLREKRNATKGAAGKEQLASDIAKMVDDLKPYMNERSDLNKSKPKFPMCEKRRYRFLKEPRGILPTVIQNLLDARKHTRKVDMKAIGQELEACVDPVRIKELKSILDVLDKRQLAYKVSCNSMYGAMGVRRGYLPFMPGAMCTTYMGRVNIERVADAIPRKFGGELVYGDTDCVVAETPLLVRDPVCAIKFMSVDQISCGDWVRINPNKEISHPLTGYEIWSDSGWTPIVNVVRCGIIKPLTKILTHIGVVECSNEHSLLREDLTPVTPLEINIGDKLCTTEFPLPLDTPTIPMYDNCITTLVIRDYVIPDVSYNGISAQLAFIWGFFFADGSCGIYHYDHTKCENQISKCSWAINKQDVILLDRMKSILEVEEPDFEWVCLDVMKSSHVSRIVPRMKIRKHDNSLLEFVERWRVLFYDSRGNKKVPNEILSMPLPIRQSFFMGYYAGDGSKQDPSVCMSNKGSVGTAGLFFLMRSIGYNVSINTRSDKPMVYKLTASSTAKVMRKTPNAIKKIIHSTGSDVTEGPRDYIYDIQTGNHHFVAGIGQLVVHNSNYIHFPHLKTAQETWDHAIYVADELTKMFPKPIELEFEKEIYDFFFILTKKRYMYRKCLRDGVVDDKIGKKGVLLARRDNSKFIRDVYERVISMIADNKPQEQILDYVIEELNQMCSNCKPINDFVVTKAVGDTGGLNPLPFKNEKGDAKAKVGDYTVSLIPDREKDPLGYDEELAKKGATDEKEYYLLCLPAQVQLAERMRRRGQRVDVGSRLEYVISDPDRHTAKQYEKVESVEYMAKHKDVLRVDYLYYVKALANPLDQVLSVAFKGVEDFVLDQYNFRYKIRGKMLIELKNLTRPRLKFT